MRVAARMMRQAYLDGAIIVSSRSGNETRKQNAFSNFPSAVVLHVPHVWVLLHELHLGPGCRLGEAEPAPCNPRLVKQYRRGRDGVEIVSDTFFGAKTVQEELDAV